MLSSDTTVLLSTCTLQQPWIAGCAVCVAPGADHLFMGVSVWLLICLCVACLAVDPLSVKSVSEPLLCLLLLSGVPAGLGRPWLKCWARAHLPKCLWCPLPTSAAIPAENVGAVHVLQQALPYWLILLYPRLLSRQLLAHGLAGCSNAACPVPGIRSRGGCAHNAGRFAMLYAMSPNAPAYSASPVLPRVAAV